MVNSISTSNSFRLLLLTQLTWVWFARGEVPTVPSDDDPVDTWDALIASYDELLEWSEDPLDELDLAPEVLTVWSVSARAGVGESNNFLKRQIEEKSRYFQLEGDAFLNLLFENASLTALVFYEYTRYEEQFSADSESLVFLHTNWSFFRDLWTWGLELDALYGDQIYDASLSDLSDPLGENFRQFRPEVSLFGERSIGSRDTLGAKLSLRRALYGDSEEDYWRPELTTEWTRNWSPGISTETIVSLFSEYYDEEQSKRADGLAVNPAEDLLIHGFALQGSMNWKPRQWPAFGTTLRAGLSAETDQEGDYESVLRLFSSFSVPWKSDWVTLRMDGRWQNLRYEERYSDFSDVRPQRQTYREFRLEVERDLIWNTSLSVGVEWSDFMSRTESDSFSERRVEALLEWSY